MGRDREIRTLVVEDNPEMRDLIVRHLAVASGFSICATAVNGVEAISRAAECQPDLILLDIVMPVMAGDAALPAVREAAPMATVAYLSMLADADLEGRRPGRPVADIEVAKNHFLKNPTDVLAELRALVEGNRR